MGEGKGKVALINCPECGTSVSDRAPSCPCCGYPFQMDGHLKAMFYLLRDDAEYLRDGIYDVYLDHYFRGKIHNGETLKTLVACRSHHLELVDVQNNNRTVYEGDIYVAPEGLALFFTAAEYLNLIQVDYHEEEEEQGSNRGYEPNRAYGGNGNPARSDYSDYPRCPNCGGKMTMQTVVEPRKLGCGMLLLCILLSATILGLLLVFLILRKRTEPVTYAVCQLCGTRIRMPGQRIRYS